MATRVRLETLNLTLRGYGPEAAGRLARDLPAALARRLASPDAPIAPDDLAGRVAGEVAAELRRLGAREG